MDEISTESIDPPGPAASCSYTTPSSLAERVEISARSMSRSAKRKRKYCEHCEQEVALKMFKRHKHLYCKDDGSWIKEQTEKDACESSSVSQQGNLLL